MSTLGSNSPPPNENLRVMYLQAAVHMLDRLPQRYPHYHVMMAQGARKFTQGGTIGTHPIGGFDTCVILTPAKESLGFYFPMEIVNGKITVMLVATDHADACNPDGLPSLQPDLPASQLGKIAYPTGLKKPMHRLGFT